MIHMDRIAQKTSEIPKLQFVDKVVDVPAVLVRTGSTGAGCG